MNTYDNCYPYANILIRCDSINQFYSGKDYNIWRSLYEALQNASYRETEAEAKKLVEKLNYNLPFNINWLKREEGGFHKTDDYNKQVRFGYKPLSSFKPEELILTDIIGWNLTELIIISKAIQTTINSHFDYDSPAKVDILIPT